MEAYFSAVGASAVVVAGVTCFLGAVLLMRNPHNPAWVMNETFAQAASLLMTFGIASAVAVALNGYLAAGFSVIAAFAATGVLVALTSIAFCALTHFRERLKRADQGRSTLERLGNDYPHTGASAA